MLNDFERKKRAKLIKTRNARKHINKRCIQYILYNFGNVTELINLSCFYIISFFDEKFQMKNKSLLNI